DSSLRSHQVRQCVTFTLSARLECRRGRSGDASLAGALVPALPFSSLTVSATLGALSPSHPLPQRRKRAMQFVDPHLRRHLFGWKSPRLGLHMPIVRYGHWGPAILLFPTAGGDFLEAERMFFIKAIEPALFAGKLQVFSIDSINPYAWTSKLPIPHKARNTALYSGYVEEEVVPYI